MMATMEDILNTRVQDPGDGISFLPTLLDKRRQKERDYLYWEFHEKGGVQAIRQGKWKAVRLNIQDNPGAPIELYNLDEDPGERQNVTASHPDIIKKMKQRFSKSHVKSVAFPYRWEN